MTVTLKKGKVEAIARSLGGELISYKKNGKEYVWTGDEKYWPGRAPALFPFVSSLVDGKTLIGGKECHIPTRHGFIRQNELSLIESSDCKAVFELRESKETLENYPFKFSFRISHEICEDGFRTTFTVINKDEKDMPFCIGGHPGFLLEDGIENYKLVFEKDEDCDIGHCDEKSRYCDDFVIGKRLVGKEWELCYSDFDIDALFVKGVKSRKVSIVEKATGKVHLEFDYTGFDELVLWTAPGKKSPYLCLEPWNGLPPVIGESGNFEDKPHVRFLKKDEEYSVSYAVRV